MNRYLLETGAATFDKIENEVWLDAKIAHSDLSDLKAEMDGRMAVKDAAAYLGISVDLLLELQGAELIRSTLDALDQRPKFRRQCLNSFLERLGSKPTSAPAKNGDVSALVEAAIRVRCPTIDIIDLIMAGELTCILLDGATLGMAGIGVSVSELKRVLPPLHMPALSKGDTSRRLRMTYQSINFLVVTGHLEAKRLRNPKSRQFLDAITLESIQRFEAKFVTLGHLARINRRASGPLKAYLEGQGVCPEVGDGSVSCYYARASVAWRLEKIGFKLPNVARERSTE